MSADRIELQKGVPFTDTMTFTDDAGAAYDLAGKTVMFTVKHQDDDSDDDTDAVITKDITVHTNATAGITTLSLDADDTNVAKGDYKYDIRIYQASPAVLLNSESGICSVVDTVTKRTT